VAAFLNTQAGYRISSFSYKLGVFRDAALLLVPYFLNLNDKGATCYVEYL
jgi:hypothetical protein